MRSASFFVKPFLLCLFSSSLIVGCGGGGGESSDSKVPAIEPYVSLSQSTLSLDEGNEMALPIDYEDRSDMSVQVDGEGLLAVIDGQILVVSSLEIDRPAVFEVLITSTTGDNTQTKTLSVAVANTSANALARQVDSTLADRIRLENLSEDRQLYQFFVDFAYLGGATSYAEMASSLSLFDARGQTSFATLRDQFKALSVAKDDYRRGKIPDAGLQMALDQTDTLIREHAAYGRDMLISISNLSDVVLPGFAPQSMAYDATGGMYSRFLSNDVFGRYIDDQYQFDAAYSALSKLVRVAAADSDLCGVL